MDVDDLAFKIHQNARDKGFWDKERNFGEMLMLVTSELAEALEEHRAERPSIWFKHDDLCNTDDFSSNCECNPKPEGVLVEIADAIIRLCDTGFNLATRTAYSLEETIHLKMKYNASRERLHGKLY